jgi:hypothetical protein
MAGCLAAQAAAPPAPDEAEALRNSLPDTPGTGKFPALKEVDPRLPG